MKLKSLKKINLYLLVLSIGWISCVKGYAEIVYPTNGVSVNSSTLFYGTNYTVSDGLPSSTTYGSMRGIVTLGIDWGILDYNPTFPVDSELVIDVAVLVIGWHPGISSPSFFNATFATSDTMRLIYNPSQNVTEIDKDVITFSNVRQVQVFIGTITINGVPITSASAVLPQSLYMTTDLIVERYKTFNTGTTPTLSSITNLNNNQIRVNWNSITGAEEYDVEWTWVDAMANPQNYDFTHNSSRVTIPASSGTSYIIPTAY